MLAKIYKTAFVEASSLLSINMNHAWKDMLDRFRKFKTARDRRLYNLRNVIEPNQSPNRLMGRIMQQGRRFAKSCEEMVKKIL